ncbi:Predicted O-methyltransferase YrrM [Micromonospora matsumotoense]|uniref:Predicted O-methyltransferase YrrM n=1 Tax=Micromonospora matsumotoense TaxID=121616 RepID=A0A1C4YUJ8_9ACTN|nr:class I SAM-dependent methyltransferase [Micromonospora matsumotoense]SCF24432.1 Predicted O-methyltransferase YrrM [Micromonospora matsumotoense]
MDVLADLADAGLVPEARYPRPEFERLANLVVDRFEHAGRTTFIFPEEARLLFALAHQVRPRNAVFLGSYYGYWAIWAAPAVLASGGRMTLVDVDADAMATARSNMAALGFADSVDFVVADAIDFAQHQLRDVDLCVLDAEGPKEGPVPDLLDKAIYFPITQAVTPALLPNALLVAHNVLLQNLTANAYFAGRIEHNRAQFGKWMTHLTEHYNVHRVYPSSEGTGVYRKLGSPCAGW